MRVKTPKPFMKFADFDRFTAYCWCCEHKTLGIVSLGDTKVDAINQFKTNVIAELAPTEISFIG